MFAITAYCINYITNMYDDDNDDKGSGYNDDKESRYDEF